MSKRKVVIAGGGIGGLTLALTLNQIGVECIVYESVRALRPLGVGINIQPNAVRELFDLGIASEDLDQVGLPVHEWALVGLNGQEVYSEPRGLLAGYKWPQYAVHRGQLQMLLFEKVRERLGPGAVRLGCRVVGYSNESRGTVSVRSEGPDGAAFVENCDLLIGADGLHSAIRSQMHPDQPPIQWGGAVMWRGTSQAHPIRTGASFVGLGTHRQRLVFYPISRPEKKTGLATINWIAEVTVDNSTGSTSGDWNKNVTHDKFIHHFADWTYGWLDVPALLRSATEVWEYPMIDRDPVPTWIDRRVGLMGDAAHVMYPTGSNGASQAIVDARVLGACMVAHGVSPAALEAYDQQLCVPISEVVLRNRGAGPFGVLNIIDERCEGEFGNIDDVISPDERLEFMSNYKAAAGFAMEKLNNAPPTISEGARVF